MAGSATHTNLEGPAYRTILKLAIPTVIAMMSQAIVNAVDSVFFAHLPTPQESSDGQAALMPSLILLWMFGGALSSVSVGAQALAARRYVEGNHKQAGAVLANAMMFCVVGGLVLTAVGFFLLPWMAVKQHPSETVQTVIVDYGTYRMFGIMSMAMTMGIKGFFDGIGRTWIHFVSSVVMNIFNILFCWIFIFGNLGAPKMGAAGAGLAALLATWIGLGVMLYYVVKERRTFEPFQVSGLSMKLMWSLLKLSIPAAGATIIMMFGFQMFLTIVGKLDAASNLAAHTPLDAAQTSVNGAATSNIISMLKLTFTACIAFGTATATLVGQSLGSKRADLASKFGWASIRLGLMIFGVVGLFEGILLTPQIIDVWTQDPAVRDAMLVPMRIIGCATPIIAVVMIMSEALFGAGIPKFVAIAQLVLVFGLLLPAAYFLAITMNMGLVGIWTAATIYISVGAVVMSVEFLRGKWKTVEI